MDWVTNGKINERKSKSSAISGEIVGSERENARENCISRLVVIDSLNITPKEPEKKN